MSTLLPTSSARRQNQELDNTSRKEREFLRREQEILSAAVALFDLDGWELVTVAQIAKQAGIGKGTVYKHFASKEDIYARLSLDFHYQLMDAFKAMDLSHGVAAFLRESIAESFRFYQQHQICAKLSFFCKRSDFKKRISSAIAEEFEAMDLEFETFFSAMLQQGIDEGVIKDVPVKHLIIALEATFEGAISMLTNGSYTDFSELTKDEFSEVITQFMMSALMIQQPLATP